MTKLSNIEQTHWAHYSAPPDGGPCSEWFQTQMMQDPPHSPSVPELLDGASAELNAAWIGRFGISLYKAQPAQTEALRQGDRDRMSVGPISGEFKEIPRLAKAMYEAAIETIDFGAIRTPLIAAGVTFDKQDKQLGLLRLLLTTILGIDDSDTRQLLAPLLLVNKLRVSSAHTLQASVGDMLHAGGVNPAGFGPRSSWDALVDAVVASLTAIGKIVSSSRPSTS
jgi:phytoene dehydrogenase-like protein